jgi:hypothetical protein
MAASGTEPWAPGLLLTGWDEETIMRFKLVIPALAILTTTLAAPAYAQYERVQGPGYYGPSYYGPAQRTRVFRGTYNQIPADEPFFYNDGWVPESIYDRSRPGGIDPNINPPG